MKIKLAENKKDCLITDFRLGQFFSLLSGMPGRKKWIERDLAFQPSGANIEFCLEHLKDAEWEGGAETHRGNYLSLKMQEQNTRLEKKDELTDDSGYEFRTVPFKHQLHAFLLSRDKEVFALFHEQGSGKTKVILDTACYLYERGDINTLLVVAKSGVHINWVVEEIPEHIPERIPYSAIYYSNSMHASEYANLFSAAKTSEGLRIVTFYVEGVRYANDGDEGKMQRMIQEWTEQGRTMMVIDESSTIKNASADRSKFLTRVGKLAKKRRIMTGTPITTGVENYFSQFRFLDPRILGHESFYTFRNEYCIMGGFEQREIVAYKNMEKLINIVDGHSHRALKKDCLDLPPKVYKRRPFELPQGHRKLYDAVRKQALAEIQSLLGEERGLKLASEISVVRALRLQQITCGLTPSEKPENLEGGQPRLDALLEEIEEAEAGGNKVIVWVRFTRNLIDIAERLGKKAAQYWGKIKEDERIKSVQRFRDDPKTTIFLSNQAGAYGLSLPSGGAIYHSQSSSLDLRLQSEDRCHGIGRTRGDKVLYTDIEAIRTIDRKIINALRKNKSLADQMLQDPVSIFMEEEE